MSASECIISLGNLLSRSGQLKIGVRKSSTGKDQGTNLLKLMIAVECNTCALSSKAILVYIHGDGCNSWDLEVKGW
jgi:hypothetical protein